MKENAKVGDTIYPATYADAVEIRATISGANRVNTETPFTIIMIVNDGVNFKGPQSGVMIKLIGINLMPVDTISYPYIWNFNRFVKE